MKISVKKIFIKVKKSELNPYVRRQESSWKIVFKTTYDFCMDLYCADRSKNIIQDYELTGVVFSEN